jgi:hypothetical protein
MWAERRIEPIRSVFLGGKYPLVLAPRSGGGVTQ